MNELLFEVERLEDRRLLAVDLSFSAGSGLLRIKGDEAGDFVQVGSAALGLINVKINGDPIRSFEGVNRIVASLGAGDDELFLGKLSLGGSVSVNMGSGGDYVTVATAGISGAGQTMIGGSVKIVMGGNQDDTFYINTTHGNVVFGGNLSVTGARDNGLEGIGGGPTTEANDVNVLGNLSIRVGKPTAGLQTLTRLNNVNVGGTTDVRGSTDDDLVFIDDCSFARAVKIDLGNGNDTLLVSGLTQASAFRSRVTFNGGSGTDTLVIGTGNTFFESPKLSSFELV